MSINFDRPERIQSLELLAKQLVEGFITGMHKSPQHGFSVEFSEHRLYNVGGESTRHIDWKVFARTDRLYVKQYEEETNLRCLIAIDRSSSMRYPAGERNKLQFSIRVAAAIVHLLGRQRDAAGLCLFSDKVDLFTPIKSKPSHLSNLFGALARELKSEKRPTTRTSIAAALHEAAEKIHRRSLVILFSDLLDGTHNSDELFGALQHLKHNGHETLVFHVIDRDTELHFNFDERPHEFVDMETGKAIKAHPGALRAQFMERSSQFYQDIKLKCDQLKIDFVSTHAGEDYFEALQAYLIKRSRTR